MIPLVMLMSLAPNDPPVENDIVLLRVEGAFDGCLMVVEEPKAFGAQGYVQIPGQGRAYFRATHDQMRKVGKLPRE